MSSNFNASFNHCHHCERDDNIHIGKSSNRRFIVHTQTVWVPDGSPAGKSVTIDSWESLVEFLCVTNAVIVEENGVCWSVDEFVDRFDAVPKDTLPGDWW